MPIPPQHPNPENAVADKVAVREIVCKTILARSAFGGYTLNCYSGCAHACVYCYARFMQRFHPHEEPWGAYVDVKVNAVETLKRQLRRLPPGKVFISSACDGWQPLEAQYRLTRRCCELLLEHGFSLNLLTKSSLILRDLDLFTGKDVAVGITIATTNERLARLWEPESASVAQRWEILEQARRRGLPTFLMAAPLLPFLSDSPAEIHALLQGAVSRQAQEIVVDILNPRPRVWSSVAAMLRQHHPNLREPYRRILFDRAERNAYRANLSRRVDTAAHQLGIAQQVCFCAAMSEE